VLQFLNQWDPLCGCASVQTTQTSRAIRCRPTGQMPMHNFLLVSPSKAALRRPHLHLHPPPARGAEPDNRRFTLYPLSAPSVPAGPKEPQREREASTATSPLHPTNQRGWFHASHESAHTAGRSCRLSPYEAL